MIDYRAIYSKTGEVKYISHLDTNRCMQRALKRSCLPVWYSEGFNPHIYITFALPLSLGFESVYEIMDFRLTEEMDKDQIKETINKALPKGFEIIQVATPVKKPKFIASNDFEIIISCENVTNENVSTEDNNFDKKFSEFCSQDKILTIKKGKKGDKEVDLKPFFKLINSKQLSDRKYSLEMNFAAGCSDNINPNLLFNAFASAHKDVDFNVANIRKTKVYDEKGELFL